MFNLFESTVRTKSGKKQDLEEVLFQQQYHTIYLMLGINELGYDYQINSGIRAIAENSDCCYIDVNSIFDDENGALKTSYSTDGSHVLGKYYSVWTDWLKGESPDA